MTTHKHIDEALQVLVAIGLPRAQQNERSALSLLALLKLTPGRKWAQAENPLIGITPIMDWARAHYQKDYAPNTRETVRRQTMHQFVAAGIALYNPDDQARPVNSPKAVYQIEPATLALLRTFGAAEWSANLSNYLAQRQTLTEQYAQARRLKRIPVKMATGLALLLSPGKHSDLIKAIIEEFAPRFVQNGALIYAGDTGEKWGYFDQPRLEAMGVRVEAHGKIPDVILHDQGRNWLLLVEAVTSHGPVDGKRHAELAQLFSKASAGLVYVTAFPDRATMARYVGDIAWETEVWVADAPTHLIHFNGPRYLGPYGPSGD
jgi:type II restriction enzyme